MKKLFASAVAVLATAMLLTFGVSAVDFSVSPAATGEMLGDANGDGAVNAMDVLFVKRYAANVQPSVEVGADANCDGRINASDILAMKRHAAEIQDLSELSKDTVKILAVDGVNVKNMAVVAPEGTDPSKDNSAYAADQLRKYLRKGAGYERSVEFGTPSTEHAIYIMNDPTGSGNPTTLTDCEFGELGAEGFTIEVRDGNVYIIGGMYRGCMYGVYEFLEEYVGWRFVDENGYLYPTDIINLKSGIHDTQIPSVEYRFSGNPVGGFYRNLKMNARQYWSSSDAKNGYVIGPHFINAHSYAYYRNDMWPRPDGTDQAYQDEWNKKMKSYNESWQPCFTSDADFDEMFSGLLRYSNMIFNEWKQEYVPGQSQFSFSIMDNANYCQCASCRTLYERIGVSGASIQFASRAADMYQNYYPGVKLYTILYEHTPPADGLYVSDNLVIMYCGTGCNNHIPGTGGCGDNLTVLGGSNKIDEVSLPAWGDVSDGMYFWEYGVNYHYFLAPAPDVLNIRPDIQFAINSGCVGVYYESCSDCSYNFESLKAYIAARVMWDTEMTEEECTDLILEYLWLRYGEGYNEIYRVIEIMQECGDDAGCWINNHDRPWEMYNPETVAKYSEELISLMKTALEKADDEWQAQKVEALSMHVYFLTLCATYDDLYVNGSDDEKAVYTARYQWLYNYIKDGGYKIFTSSDYPLPDTCNLDTNPMDQFYGGGYSN